MFTIADASTRVPEYYPVLRLLDRYGSDIDLIGSFVVNGHRWSGLGKGNWRDIYMEEEFELNEKIDLEEKVDLDQTFGVEHKMDAKAESISERKSRSEAGSEWKAGFGPRKELEVSAPREHKMNREGRFLNWARVLCDLGLDVNDTSLFPRDPEMLTPLMGNVLLSVSSGSQGSVMVVFLLCILGADVSIRHIDAGLQALHMALFANYSVEASPCVEDLIYILIHYGGADPWATTSQGDSPTVLAYRYGWMEEWIVACERCGISKETLLAKERQRRLESKYLGDGESTAIDTDDLNPNILGAGETLKRRRRVAGDRLME